MARCGEKGKGKRNAGVPPCPWVAHRNQACFSRPVSGLTSVAGLENVTLTDNRLPMPEQAQWREGLS
ncbi:hypothetical protein GCM10007160_07380 [Litchfieldella qijiaojingensis]|uniref:Uncharacterized protein n=1 Tax=Litchfieldella qijiaojingensis TaxID=980347 RepID=A0ABQ2YFF5_9GAMM|nr:hypothetical protein GCM10007160_07380 [Halomonas qijiaojingensis]